MGGLQGKHENVQCDGFTYSGEYRYGSFHGDGVIKYPDGTTLKGTFFQGFKHDNFTRESADFKSEETYKFDKLQSTIRTNKKTDSRIFLNFSYNNVKNSLIVCEEQKVNENNVKVIIKIQKIEGKVDFVQLCKWLIDPPQIPEGQETQEVIFEGQTKIRNLELSELIKGEIHIMQHYSIKCPFKNNLIDGFAEMFDIQARKKYEIEFKHGIAFQEMFKQAPDKLTEGETESAN